MYLGTIQNTKAHTYIKQLRNVHGAEGIAEHVEDDLLGLGLGHDELAPSHGRGGVLPLLEGGLQSRRLGLGGLGGGLLGDVATAGGGGGGGSTTRGDGGGRNAAGGGGLGGRGLAVAAALASLLGLGRRDQSLAGRGSDGTATGGGGGSSSSRGGGGGSGRLGLGGKVRQDHVGRTSVGAPLGDEGAMGLVDGRDREVAGRGRRESLEEAELAVGAGVPRLLVLGSPLGPDGAGDLAAVLGALVLGVADLARTEDGVEVPLLLLLLLFFFALLLLGAIVGLGGGSIVVITTGIIVGGRGRRLLLLIVIVSATGIIVGGRDRRLLLLIVSASDTIVGGIGVAGRIVIIVGVTGGYAIIGIRGGHLFGRAGDRSSVDRCRSGGGIEKIDSGHGCGWMGCRLISFRTTMIGNK